MRALGLGDVRLLDEDNAQGRLANGSRESGNEKGRLANERRER